MDISYSEDVGVITNQQKPETCTDRTERLKKELKTAYDALHETGKNDSIVTDHFMQNRVVVVDAPIGYWKFLIKVASIPHAMGLAESLIK